MCPRSGGFVPGVPTHRQLSAVVLLPAALGGAAARSHHLRGILHGESPGQPGMYGIGNLSSLTKSINTLTIVVFEKEDKTNLALVFFSCYICLISVIIECSFISQNIASIRPK